MGCHDDPVKPAQCCAITPVIIRQPLRVGATWILALGLCAGCFWAPRSAPARGEDKAPPRAAAQPAPESPEATVLVFGNATPITINDNTTATPYPSSITVSGVNPATVTKVQVVLGGFTHSFPDDVDIILVGPQGQQAMLMSDAGGGNPGVSNLQLTFSATAATAVPDGTGLVSGTFRPANYGNGRGVFTDTFPPPGPGTLTDAPADLSVFNLTNPNGVWRLYVVDDAGQDVGNISGGWLLALTVPQVFTVTKTADTNDGVCDADCSLREALALAQNGDLINFSTLFNTSQTINLTSASARTSRKSITIQGPGANLLTVQRAFNAAPDFRIFVIAIGSVRSRHQRHDHQQRARPENHGNFGFGGGIFSLSNLTLTNVNVTGNQAQSDAGGVSLQGLADGAFYRLYH